MNFTPSPKYSDDLQSEREQTKNIKKLKKHIDKVCVNVVFYIQQITELHYKTDASCK